ncbi:fibrillin-1-like [Symsagittifera roscoffensis]|uniref:fibrillin-1-like n=1 Tax=Symsagittifera roscoffensis TaxID=84072 RepID=UPI00307C787C
MARCTVLPLFVSLWLVVTLLGSPCGGVIQSFLCSDEVRLTYTLAYSIPTLKEWGLTLTECFDRLFKFSHFARTIVYCPAHHFCGTNITVNFLNSFPSVTRNDVRECNVYATSLPVCEDIENLLKTTEKNECAKLMQGCGPCENFVGGYWCNCVTGFQPDFAEQNCLDVDECLENPCDSDGYCENNVGSFECFCNQGYEGNGFNCSDVDECLDEESCHWRASCTNHPGTHSCYCNAGYEGDDCADVDECARGVSTCNVDTSSCVNTIGSFDCSCKAGFVKDQTGDDCVEKDDCNPDPCPDNSDCVDQIGGFECECHEGYKGNKYACVDIDECFELTENSELTENPCGENSRCNNSVFPYECTCFEGYGPEQPCPDIDECLLNLCHTTTNCNNLEGSFECKCPVGYMELGEQGVPTSKRCEPQPYYFSEIKYTHENMDDDAHITNLQANLEMSADGLHNLQFYAREPLTDQQEYVRLQIYTGTYEYRSLKFFQLIQPLCRTLISTAQYWSNTFDVFLIVPFGEEIEDNLELENNRTDLFQLRNGQSDFYACISGCLGKDYLVKVCDLGYYMSLFRGNNNKCTSTWAGTVTSLQFHNRP